ncbi:MAG: hypothetical protein AB7V50_04360 [Vampirovibrionia bacterium]
MLVNNNNVSFTAKGVLKFDQGLKGNTDSLITPEKSNRSILVGLIQDSFKQTMPLVKQIPQDEVTFRVKSDGIQIKMGKDINAVKKASKDFSVWQFLTDPVQCVKDTLEAFEEMGKVRFKRRID